MREDMWEGTPSHAHPFFCAGGSPQSAVAK